jgi:hypothetical protein
MTLFLDYRPIKLSMDHSAGITVDEFSKPIPCERAFAGCVSICIPGARPGGFLSHSPQIIPNQSFSVSRALVPRAIRTIREQQKEGGANKKAADAHRRFRFNSSQHPLMHSENIQSSP